MKRLRPVLTLALLGAVALAATPLAARADLYLNAGPGLVPLTSNLPSSCHAHGARGLRCSDNTGSLGTVYFVVPRSPSGCPVSVHNKQLTPFTFRWHVDVHSSSTSKCSYYWHNDNTVEIKIQ
jgi:hypothetical protein